MRRGQWKARGPSPCAFGTTEKTGAEGAEGDPLEAEPRPPCEDGSQGAAGMRCAQPVAGAGVGSHIHPAQLCQTW